MQGQEIEAFGLTKAQLNVLIATYYEKVGWIPEDHGQRGFLEIKSLVGRDLLYITSLVRQKVAVAGIDRRGLPTFYTDPVSIHCAVAITDGGKELVAQVNLSRRADACVAEGDEHVIRNFVGTLSLGELPELLSSEHEALRGAARDRLDKCLGSTSMKDLPELLADSDPVVREAGGSALDQQLGICASKR